MFYVKLRERLKSFSNLSTDDKPTSCNHCSKSQRIIKGAAHLLSKGKKSEWKRHHRTAASDSFQDQIQKYCPSQDSPWVFHLPELIVPVPSPWVFTINCTISVSYHNNVIINNSLCNLWVWQWLTHHLTESYFYIYSPSPILHTSISF